MNSKDKEILRRILRYCGELEGFICGVGYSEFENNIEKNRACVLTLEQIGENAKRLSLEFKNANSKMPWQAMADMRNRIAHDYDGIFLDIVWETITTEIPELSEYIKNILEDKE